MKWSFSAFSLLTALCISISTIALADSPPLKPLVINESGIFQDQAVWLYRTPEGRHGFGPAVKGTNELLVMPSPSPQPGGSVEGVEILRHRFDTLGYPIHVGLVEKLFAASYQIKIYASNNGEIWSYDYGDPVANEKTITNSRRSAFKVWGPFHADAVPLSQAPEQDIQGAFEFAKGVMKSIGNMPEAQKNLENYGVLFTDDGNTIWVEVGPRFATNEAPHLGCQTQLGRDMVFGFNKKQPNNQGASGKFLQCF